MSHTVKTKSVAVKNAAILEKAVKALAAKGIKISMPNGVNNQSVKLYQGNYNGVAVTLDGWTYPVVIDTQKGELAYDNFNGSWGKQAQLDELLQEYVKQEAIDLYSMQGFMVDEINTQYLPNGDLELCLKSFN